MNAVCAQHKLWTEVWLSYGHAVLLMRVYDGKKNAVLVFILYNKLCNSPPPSGQNLDVSTQCLTADSYKKPVN